MKKNVLKIFVAVAGLFMPGVSDAQMVNETFTKSLVPYKPSVNMQSATSRAATCGVDTILYPWYKESYFAAPNDSFFVDAMVGSVRTASQAYLNTDTVSVHGIQFWGAAYSTGTSPQTLPVKAYLYNIDAMNMPTTIIDSALVTINQNYNFYEALFALPVTVTGNFAVAVRSQLNDTLAVITNNAGNVWTPDYGEGLAWRRFGSGAWNSAESFFGQDLEYMIFPIVSYNIHVDMATTSNDTICEGDSITFNNTSSSIMQNRMFNLYEFGDYWNNDLDSTFFWVYDDGDFGYSLNGGNTYNTPGTYTPKVYGVQLGYYTFCWDSAWMTLNVMPDVAAGFTVDNSAEPMFSFTNTSTGGMTYSWDFGDGGTATTPNAMHTYTANGTYNVMMIVNGFCGADTLTQQVTVTSIDVNTAKANLVKAYFTATDKSLVVEGAETGGSVNVYDMLGKSVLHQSVNAKISRMNVSSLPEGTYIVKVISGDVTKTTRFVLTK